MPDSKLLIVSHYTMPHIGGIEQVVANQSAFLAEQGFTVTVVCATAETEVPGISVWRKVPVIRLKTNNFVVRKFNIPFPLFGISAIVTIWKAVRAADVVHIHDVFYQTSWYAGVFAVLMRKPIFLTQHVAMVDHASKAVTLIQKIVYATFGTLLFKRSKSIVVYNKHVKDFLVGRGVAADKVHLLANGIDTTVFRPVADEVEKNTIRTQFGLPLTKKLVLFAGRFVDKKGYDIAYAARSQAYELVFVGTGDFPEAWKNEPGVIFLGAQSPEQLALLYRSCDAFIFPTIGEVMTLTMQEALASGLPVVTTENDAYGVYTLTDAVYFVPRTPAAFRAKLEGVLASTEHTMVRARYAREFAVSHFDAKTNSRQLLEIYGSYLALS